MASAAYHAADTASQNMLIENARKALKLHKQHFGKLEHALLLKVYPNAGAGWESSAKVTAFIRAKFAQRLTAKEVTELNKALGATEKAESVETMVKRMKQEKAERLTPPEYKEDTDWTAKPYSPPESAQATFNEGNDQSKRESSENATVEPVEAPAAKESTKDTSEKLVAVDDIKLHDIIIWETTTLKKPVTCKVNRLEYGDQGKLIRIFATPVNGEFTRLDISAPLCKLQRKKIKVVRS